MGRNGIICCSSKLDFSPFARTVGRNGRGEQQSGESTARELPTTPAVKDAWRAQKEVKNSGHSPPFRSLRTQQQTRRGRKVRAVEKRIRWVRFRGVHEVRRGVFSPLSERNRFCLFPPSLALHVAPTGDAEQRTA